MFSFWLLLLLFLLFTNSIGKYRFIDCTKLRPIHNPNTNTHSSVYSIKPDLNDKHYCSQFPALAEAHHGKLID